MNREEYYNRDKTLSYKAVFVGTIMILLLAAIECAQAERFVSNETAQSTKEGKKWSGWSIIIPADKDHMEINVTKKLVTIENANRDMYFLDKPVKRKPATVKREMAAIFVYNATDQKGQKWVISICRTRTIEGDDSIYAIQFENDKIMTVYQ